MTEVFGVNYLVSATISFTASVIFNYLASMRYVFTHKEGMSRRREFVIFVTLSVIGLIINNLCMWAGVELAHIHYLITKIGATFIVMVWNFVTRKYFPRWRRRARRNAERELDHSVYDGNYGTHWQNGQRHRAAAYHARRGIGGCAQRCS